MAEKVGTIYYDLDLDDSKYNSKSKNAGDQADNFGERVKNSRTTCRIRRNRNHRIDTSGRNAGQSSRCRRETTECVDGSFISCKGYWKQTSTPPPKQRKDLSADGLMPLGDAASGLKNLLASGMSLDQAIKLMKAFKDSAAFGRQGSLEFGQAIVRCDRGYQERKQRTG
jgi:hypothetical protein